MRARAPADSLHARNTTMVTETAHPSAMPDKPPPVPEEFHGAFGFFRKYQKHILYTAVMFALITFSVTGAMTAVFSRFTHPSGPRPSIRVNGHKVEIEEEDQEYGRLIANAMHRQSPSSLALLLVLPQLQSDASDTELVDVLALLRRASLADGLDVSDIEVDRAIEYARNATNAETATKLALQGGFSLAQFRAMVREAMRIGNYVRLQVLGTAGTDQDVIDDLLDGQEKLTLRVASLDAKKIEEELKQTGTISDDDLKQWLDGKDDNWKAMNQAYDTNRVSLQIGACKFDGFDPKQWEEEL